MRPPVFIVGCPRSGTSFLYHLLLSAGGFAEFHTQMNAFDVLEPIYGDLRSAKNKQKMMRDWLGSKAFQVSGLKSEEIEAKVMAECHDASSFLRIVMDEISRAQGVDRWVDSTPTNVPHMLRIAKDFPDASFVHIIRDGRDVALSLDKRGWTRPMPFDKKQSLLSAGPYWKWIIQTARKQGATIGPSRYFEIRYEDLVEKPAETLPKLGAFLQHDLSWDRIQRTSIGSVKSPLTSFSEDLREGNFSPVGRWKTKFTPDQLAWFEALVGDFLQELGYSLGCSPLAGHPLAVRTRRAGYAMFYELKQWAKVNTPLSKWMVSYADILIDK